MRAALERMGLRGFFCAEVTAEDGMETLAQRLLSAAIKLARPPDHCVVFETSPVGVCAAHNCTMKVRVCVRLDVFWCSWQIAAGNVIISCLQWPWCRAPRTNKKVTLLIGLRFLIYGLYRFICCSHAANYRRYAAEQSCSGRPADVWCSLPLQNSL